MFFLVRICVSILTALFASGVGEARSTARPTVRATAVTGSLVLSPAKPVCRVGEPCTRPLAGYELVFSRRKTPVARVRTDREGRYRTALPPGAYTVTTPAHRPGLGRGLVPDRIQVPVARRATRNFTFDAGIR